LLIQPQKPIPTDKCSVCFWGQDITDQVMAGLWDELTAAQRALESSYGKIDLRPHLIPIWERMNQPIELGQYGWLLIRPTGLRLNRMQALGDSLDLSIGLRARPLVVNTLPNSNNNPLPTDWDPPTVNDGFRVRLEADLQFDSLSRIVNRRFLPVELTAKKGPFRKKVRIDSLTLTGSQTEQIQCQIHLSGKYAGVLSLAAVPQWDSVSGIWSLQQIEFDLQTRHRILGTAADLFDRPIRQWLEQKGRFDLRELLEEKRNTLNEYLKNAGNELIRCRGELERVYWLGSTIDSNGIRIQLEAQGTMRCTADLSRISL
jgi:hypothetical protein